MPSWMTSIRTFISRDWDCGYRAQRITDMIRAKDKLSADDIKAIHGDDYDLFADQLMPYLKVLKAEHAHSKGRARRADEMGSRGPPR